MRNAFTMIELVFVIVILGILATVVVPRIAATKGDAVTAKLAQNIMMGASEIASYAMSKSNVDNNFTLMSNAMYSMQRNGDAVVSDSRAEIKAGDVSDCVIVSVDTNDTTGVDTLNVTFSDAGSDKLCISLQGAVDANRYPMKLRGSNVTY